MKRKGFTLVELLAVIVILAIIALIAIPIVSNYITNAKKSTFEQTFKNIIDISKIYQAGNFITECRYFSFENDVEEVTIRDNKTYYPLKELNLKGDFPTEGEVKICRDSITLEASNGLYSGSYDGKDINIGKGDLASNDLKNPIIDIFNTTPSTSRIIVVVSAHSQSVGGIISNYYYKIDDEDYVKTTEKSYIFDNLEANKEYTITVKVENKSGITTEESKKVTTKAFGELTINVEKSGEWTSSKKVTITGTTEEYTIEYKVVKYNEETLQREESEFTTYTEPFILNTIATREYPTEVVVRYNDNGHYSEYKSYQITKIDTSAPTNTSPVVNVSTTKPTSEASVVIRQADSESGLDENTIEYGYSVEENGTYTWQTSSQLTKLTAGKPYYIKTKVKNNVGTLVESEVAKYTPGAINSCSVTPLTSGWATNKDVRITGSQTGTELQYQVGGTSADNWTTIENNGTVNVTENTTVYCRLWDGTTAGGTGAGSVNQIDTTGPTATAPTITQSSSDARALVVTNKQADSESGLNSGTLSYGYSTSSNGTYTWQTSNTFSSLVAGTTYYFKTKITNNVGIESISNSASGKIAYTGIPAGTYSAGSSITYAGVDWLVINDNGSNVTLITKSNIGTGRFSGQVWDTAYESESSIAKPKVDEWFNNNSVLLADKNVLALVADSSTGYYIRLPRSNELSTNIPNASDTPFWTMTQYQTISESNNSYDWMLRKLGVVVALSDGSASHGIELIDEHLIYKYMISNGSSGNMRYASTKMTEYMIANPTQNSLVVSAAKAISSDIYYSKNSIANNEDVFVVGCDAVFGVTPVSYRNVPAGDSTCKKYSPVYEYTTVGYGSIGYRPVITVKEK